MLGESHRPQLRVRQLEDTFRLDRFTGQGGEALEDGYRRLAIQLLINDGFRQAVEFRPNSIRKGPTFAMMAASTGSAFFR